MARRLVEELHSVGIAQRAVGQANGNGIPVVLDRQHRRGRRRERKADHAGKREAGYRQAYGLRPQHTIARRFLPSPSFDVGPAFVVYQPSLAAQLGHHAVAGIDAETAVDAGEIRAFADVDPDRANRDALAAVDAIARWLALPPQFGGLLRGDTLLAAVVVNRRSKLTPHRLPILTPSCGELCW